MPQGILFPLDQREPLSLHEYTSLGDYQRAVGGYIEGISTGGRGLSFLANDNAKLTGEPVNRRATLFWWLHTPAVRHHDLLCGAVVLIGPADRRGAIRSVPDRIRQLLFTHTALAVQVRAPGHSRWHQAPPACEDYFEAAAWGLRFTEALDGRSDLRVVARR